MKKNFNFTFANLEKEYLAALDAGYEFLTCKNYFLQKTSLPTFTVVNRVDIDISVSKAERLLEIFNRLKIKASFFVRLHAKEYNPFSFENYRILKAIRDTGHEIGYHSEIIDQASIWREDATNCLKRDIDILNRMLDIQISGVASHGGITGLNNLSFWDQHEAKDFNLQYEAYDKSEKFNLFNNSFYISDSEWSRWKCYEQGQLVKNDHRSFSEHLKQKHSLIYLLIHPETYYDHHVYE